MKTVNSQKSLVDLVNHILADQAEKDCTLCSAVYSEVNLTDSIIVRWMEADGNSTMNSMIEHLDTELFKVTGRHFNMCNNTPTDGALLIFWEEMNDEQWHRSDHIDFFLKCFKNWQIDSAYMNFREWTVQFETLDDAIGRCCIAEPDLKSWFNPDEETWVQIMDWNRNGFPEEV